VIAQVGAPMLTRVSLGILLNSVAECRAAVHEHVRGVSCQGSGVQRARFMFAGGQCCAGGGGGCAGSAAAQPGSGRPRPADRRRQGGCKAATTAPAGGRPAAGVARRHPSSFLQLQPWSLSQYQHTWHMMHVTTWRVCESGWVQVLGQDRRVLTVTCTSRRASPGLTSIRCGVASGASPSARPRQETRQVLQQCLRRCTLFGASQPSNLNAAAATCHDRLACLSAFRGNRDTRPCCRPFALLPSPCMLSAALKCLVVLLQTRRTPHPTRARTR